MNANWKHKVFGKQLGYYNHQILDSVTKNCRQWTMNFVSQLITKGVGVQARVKSLATLFINIQFHVLKSNHVHVILTCGLENYILKCMSSYYKKLIKIIHYLTNVSSEPLFLFYIISRI